ncbi:syntaxin [Steccherinum ochraceum]|uniref:Syntaxin n=1 Tax=Steccherinum ochraceum TaxID=92696 RepID=A0A4R0RWZ0_9APHY|nr:syntaxin [Steccherinum ochraceum]
MAALVEDIEMRGFTVSNVMWEISIEAEMDAFETAEVTAVCLTAQRQQQQGEAPQQPQSHEMANVYTPVSITPAATNGASNGGSTDLLDKGPSDFYTEINGITDSIQQFNANVQRISDLQQRSLSTADDGSQQSHAVLDDLSTQTRDLGNSIKNRIQQLEKQPVQPGEDIRMRKNRISFARNKFVEALQNYQTVERDYRAKYKQRVERQFKIVKPDATPEEISAVVDDVQGGGDQIFAQALTSSTRYGESRAAYREVQDRHEDIRRIERTLEELAQLFNDMSTLVTQQDDAIQGIETSAQRVEADTEGGLTQTEKAVKYARSARRKRWICFFLILIILAIIGIAVGVTVGKK